MFRRNCNKFIYISAVGIGTLIAFFCPIRVLVIILAILVVILGLNISRY